MNDTKPAALLVLAAGALLACEGTLSSPGKANDDDKTSGVDDQAFDEAACEVQPARIWKLTPEQQQRTFESVLPDAPQVASKLSQLGTAAHGYSNEASRLDMSVSDVERLFNVAGDVAQYVVDSSALETTHPCMVEVHPTEQCLNDFLASFGQRALRGRMTTSEQEEYREYFRERESTYDSVTALRSMLHALFLSPRFLYRTELGAETLGDQAALTSFEVAELIAYTLSDGPPDDELWALAESDELAGDEVVQEQVERLLSSAESAPGVLAWLDEMFQPEGAASTAVALEDFGLDANILEDMIRESREFFAHLLWEDGADYRQLYQADYSLVNTRLAEHYGAPDDSLGEAFEPRTLPHRQGVLTHGALMTQLTSGNQPDPITRGLFVREVLLCQEMPPTPPGLNVVFPDPSDFDTIRELLMVHQEEPSCATCHSLTDPIGFTFGNFDAVGAYVTEEAGRPVDTSGSLFRGGEQADIPLSDLKDLADYLAESEEAAECIAKQAFRHSMGRLEDEAADACVIQEITARLAESDGNLLELRAALLLQPGAFVRAQPQ